MAKIGRRKFISGILAAGASIYIGGWWFFKVRKGDASDYIISVLRKRLDYLTLDNDGLKRFARDFQERTSPRRRYWNSWLGILSPVYAVFDFYKITPQPKRFSSFETEIVTQYLLGSDFFIYDADTNRTIHYLQFYDTFETGCANPFANF